MSPFLVGYMFQQPSNVMEHISVTQDIDLYGYFKMAALTIAAKMAAGWTKNNISIWIPSP